jgi:hypothetical protein
MHQHVLSTTLWVGSLKEQDSMIKLVYCITKKAELTDEQFFHYNDENSL